MSLTIGWKEFVDLPDWGIRHVKAKIDTGARTSAIDVVRYELIPTEDGGLMVELHLALHPRRPDRVQVVRTPVLRMVAVRNTGGVSEDRPLIETSLRLGPVTKRVLVTITSRPAMRFRMIVGRKVLEGDFVVDVGRKYLLRRVRGAP